MGSLYLACDEKHAYSLLNFYDTVHLALDYIDTLYANCASPVADSFMFYNDSDIIMSLSDNNQANVTEGFNFTSRHLDDIVNIYNPYFE